jgi:tripartite ATP-independent transporter DctP family solute receptor
LISAAATVAVMSLLSPARAEPVILRISSPMGPEHSTSKAIEILKTEVVRRTHGDVDIEFTPSMQMSAKAAIDSVHSDAIFAAVPTPAYLSRLVPEIETLNLPFVIKDAAHARRVVEGDIGKIIKAKLVAKGFYPLCWMAFGARHVTNSKRPIMTLDDFKDLKIRVQPSETYTAAFQALGARVVTMDLKDVYDGLQQGDIDGQENPYFMTYDRKFYEAQKYVSDTGHVFDYQIVVASVKALMALPPEHQKALKDAAAVATAQQWKMAAAVEEEALAGLKAKGMQFDPIPAETRVALKKAMAGVIDNAKHRLGAAFVDQVIAAGTDRERRRDYIKQSNRPRRVERAHAKPVAESGQ